MQYQQFNTLIETGGKFTTNAYTQAWTEGEFWKASKIQL